MTKVSFGFRTIDSEEKTANIDKLFTDVADNYDLMNDWMSLGMHRLWKKYLVARLRPHPAQTYLDLAGGTGDIARAWLQRGGKQAIVCDLALAMLQTGRTREASMQFLDRLCWVQGNVELLPFASDSFPVAGIAFGLRNVTFPQKLLHEVVRVLRPGGRFYCLEFSQPDNRLISKLYDRYSKVALPELGARVAGNRAAYRYLYESIRSFPPRLQVADWFRKAGMIKVEINTIGSGIVCLHSGLKP